MNITIPESLRNRMEEFAREEGVPVEDFIVSVLSQRIAIADADSYVRRRAARGSAERLQESLEKAPEVEPELHDRINRDGEQDGALQPATRPASKTE